MTTTNFSQLTLNKLTQDQFNTAKSAGTLSETEFYLTPEQAVTFTTSGGAAAGVTYDGSAAVTVSYTTVGAAASTHYHGSNYINAMTSYSKGSSTAAISTSDTLNKAMGKLESRLDNAVTLTVTNNNPTASWGSAVNIGTVAGTTLSFTMPAQPSDNDIKVKQTAVSSGTTDYYLLASYQSSPTSGNAYEARYNSNIKLNGSGQLTAKTFYATSDARLKENIVPYYCKASILDLPIYQYTFIADDSKGLQIGCLAQDLQKICPEIVKQDSDGYLSINESKLTYLLLLEVKRLNAELETLKKETR